MANTSQHLAVLRHTGLVDTQRAGTTIHYRLSEPELVAACDIINRIVEHRLGRAGGEVSSSSRAVRFQISSTLSSPATTSI